MIKLEINVVYNNVDEFRNSLFAKTGLYFW